MFRLVVQYFGFLKRIPLVAAIFDALLMIWYSVKHPEITTAIASIEEEISNWPGINLSMHKFGGVQFNYGTKEIGHIHSNGILDILFNKKIKNALIERGDAVDHHVFNHSGWISFYIQSLRDAENAIKLLELSYNQRRGVAKRLEIYFHDEV